MVVDDPVDVALRRFEGFDREASFRPPGLPAIAGHEERGSVEVAEHPGGETDM